MNRLSEKIKNKTYLLKKEYQELGLYEKLLKEKYGPVFEQMHKTISDRKLEYMTFLTKKLNQNRERVQLEKETFEKLMQSYEPMIKGMEEELVEQKEYIKEQDEKQKKLLK